MKEKKKKKKEQACGVSWQHTGLNIPRPGFESRQALTFDVRGKGLENKRREERERREGVRDGCRERGARRWRGLDGARCQVLGGMIAHNQADYRTRGAAFSKKWRTRGPAFHEMRNAAPGVPMTGSRGAAFPQTENAAPGVLNAPAFWECARRP